MKHTYLKSFFSTFAVAMFLWLAETTWERPFSTDIGYEEWHLGGDKYKREGLYCKPGGIDCTHITQLGNKDKKGRWHGAIKIESGASGGGANIKLVEEVEMVHGVRHGKAKYTYHDGTIKYICYDMGVKVDCEGNFSGRSDNETAYDILEDQYPWYLFFMNAIGFEEENIQSFVDRIETIMAGYEFDFEEFDEYYDSALEEMEESENEFAEIVEVNSIKVVQEGYESLKPFELRLAFIDRYRQEGNSTYNIVKVDYPGFLNSVITYPKSEATEYDFELFCNEMDSRMDSLGPLDIEDPFFTDSLDSRMFIAFYSILLEIALGDTSLAIMSRSYEPEKAFSLNQLQRYASLMLKSLIGEGNLENAAIIVGELMEQEYYKGDIIRQCVKKAYSGSGSGDSKFAGQWEYWFNDDYTGKVKSSFGKTGSKIIPSNGLDAGMHVLYFRFRDTLGLWSIPQSYIFFKGGQSMKIYEYWFDDDEEGKSYIITETQGSLNFNKYIQTSHLADRMHWIHFRFKDSGGIYGPVQSHLFWKTGQKIVAYEYWFDYDHANIRTGQIAGKKEEKWIELIEIDAVNFEKIYARYKDSGGLWSSIVSLDYPDPLHTNSSERHMNITIFPNPAADILNISYQAVAGESVVLTVYDIQGNRVFVRNLGTSTGVKQSKSIHVNQLIDGIYLLVFETPNGRSLFKAIINR